MKFLKNKKGEGQFLGEETVKFIVSLGSISILFLLAGSLFYIFVQPNDIRQAEATLEEIVRISGNLGEGEIGRVVVTGPVGWYILGFENKLCICNSLSEVPCDDGSNGVCDNVDNVGVSLNSILLKGYGDVILIEEVMEVLVVHDGKTISVFNSEYNDFISARDFLDTKFVFSDGKFVMREYILDYIKLAEIFPVYVASIGKGYAIHNSDNKKEKEIINNFNNYFSNLEIENMVIIFKSSDAVSNLFSSATGSHESSFMFNIGEHETVFPSGEILSGDIYVKFSK